VLDKLTSAAVAEIPRLASALLMVGLAWFVGQGLTVKWNIRQKRREFDLTTARDFHALYGEFFAVWKLWNYFCRDVGAGALPGASRWELLKRSCESEGKLEATLVRLACDRSLTPPEIEILGSFRQLYQMLRQSIKANRPLSWDASDNPQYVEFKRLAPEIARIIVAEDGSRVGPGGAATALREITSNRHEQRTHQ
jgi:hypothetical protein